MQSSRRGARSSFAACAPLLLFSLLVEKVGFHRNTSPDLLMDSINNNNGGNGDSRNQPNGADQGSSSTTATASSPSQSLSSGASSSSSTLPARYIVAILLPLLAISVLVAFCCFRGARARRAVRSRERVGSEAGGDERTASRFEMGEVVGERQIGWIDRWSGQGTVEDGATTRTTMLDREGNEELPSYGKYSKRQKTRRASTWSRTCTDPVIRLQSKLFASDRDGLDSN